MPYTKVGVKKISDHRVMSPLKNDMKACMQCHTQTAEWLKGQVTTIQDRTISLQIRAGNATAGLAKLFEITHKAQAEGKTIDTALYNQARDYYEEAFYRSLFIGAENSVGFHNPTEAMRVLGDSTAFATKAEGYLRQALMKAGVDVPVKVDLELAKAMIMEYGLVNADVVIREDVDQDQLVDVLAGNRIYINAVLAINKIDISDETYLKEIRKKLKNWDPVLISAVKDIGIDELKAKIFDKLELIRVYMKKQGEDADLDEPLIAKSGSTVGDVCDSMHYVFRQNFRYALVWGKSARFPGQMVGLEHRLADGDVLSVIIRRTGE